MNFWKTIANQFGLISAIKPNLTEKRAIDSPPTAIKKIQPIPLDKNNLPTILILTPVKDGEKFLPQYIDNLFSLSYPHHQISLGFLESDSLDHTFAYLQESLPKLEQEFRKVHLYQRHFNYYLTKPRWDVSIQYQRRAIMAKSRNILCHQALEDEDWVLWLDVDVKYYPSDIIQQLLETGKDIIVPNCVWEKDGKTFDLNTFKFKPNAIDKDWSIYLVDDIIQPPKGEGRIYLGDLKDYEIIQVDGVGGTMLLIKADIHREGLNFPCYSYKHYIETEGLAMMAKDMGYSCWGLPQLEIIHSYH